MRKFFTIFSALTFMLLAQNAYSETAPAQPDDGKIMIDAATKFLDGTTAHLKGKKEESEKYFNESIGLYDSVLSRDPTNMTALNARGVAKNYLKAGSGNEDLKLAIALSTQAIEANNSSAQAYYNRATSFRSKKMFNEAREDYKMAINLNPEKASWASDLKAMEAEAAKAPVEAPKVPTETINAPAPAVPAETENPKAN